MGGKRLVVILLGTHFLFNEELGSRLRGVGYTVYPYDNPDHLNERLENNEVELIIVDLQHQPSGGLETIKLAKQRSIPVLALGEHKKTGMLDAARNAGADKVIINSQASKSIEKYVSELLS